MGPVKPTQRDLDRLDLIMQGQDSDFSAELFRSIQKASQQDRSILAESFPDHVIAFELWEQSPPKTRIWKCPACGHLNDNLITDHCPAACSGCLEHNEPARKK